MTCHSVYRLMPFCVEAQGYDMPSCVEAYAILCGGPGYDMPFCTR